MAWRSDLEDHRGDVSQFGLGMMTLIIGVAIGAAAALILAQSGDYDLRGRLRYAAGDWKSGAAEALARGRERVVDAIERDLGATTLAETSFKQQGVRPA